MTADALDIPEAHDPGPLPESVAEAGDTGPLPDLPESAYPPDGVALDPPEVDVDMPDVYDETTVLSEEQRVRWYVEDDGAADWALERTAEATAELRELREFYDRQQRRLDDWWTRRSREPQRTVDFFNAHLLAYATRQRLVHGRKTIDLPAGEIGTRSTAGYATPADLDMLTEWARTHHPDMLRTTTMIDLTELKAYVKATGEVPPGAFVTDDKVTAWVKPGATP